MLPWYIVDDVILRALKEDAHYLDLSCEYLFGHERGQAHLLAKGPGVMCGGEIFVRVFELLGAATEAHVLVKDGGAFDQGDTLLEIAGSVAVLLQGERTALNLLQHLCGVATMTAQAVQAVEGTGSVICDTRKTLPGLRALQKYAVTCGGGRNHRFNLSDGVMLKDNHIDACGSIEQAVRRVRTKIGHMVKIEVETRNPGEVRQALAAGADVIMLDNMSVGEMREAVQYVRAHEKSPVPLEASGDITLENAREVALAGVDILSLGALTHSVKAANISMRMRTPRPSATPL
ncbi:MAG: carboxylating nicotinate-nucleotide diphosphorylase [Oscillospiraceae bacterium]|jgi:nicotinate-nucleotide pyrophosphorylase (carboxylating)|nr:carboxylating nicotinate-nucleotide diphosphorylase [Oscillospiraceae bacterium]